MRNPRTYGDSCSWRRLRRCLSIGVEFYAPPIGVRPWGWTGSGGGFDRLPGVVILELNRAWLAERGMAPAGIVDLIGKA